ncbi:MAG: glycosyl transferase family 1 [Flavobacteriia bacterium]|nr:glycosyl transferase family 1 [Flavobacteriia bacterium]
MKKVLIITYYWPPGSGPGVQRFLKFSKYLREFAWEPVILTVDNGSYPSIDQSLEQDIPNGVHVYRSQSFEPFRWYNLLKGKTSKNASIGAIGLQSRSFFQRLALYIRANFFIPDARVGWNRYAIKKARTIFKEHDIDAIISTGPPHSSHLIAYALKKKYKKPWIADLRDPWTTVFYNAYFPRIESVKKKDKQLEDLVLKNADSVSVVSQGMHDEFSDRSNDISLIYNGFDDADFKGLKKDKNDKFTIAYVGNFKPNQNAVLVWECLKELGDKNAQFKSDLNISLTGNIDSSVVNSLQENGLKEQLSIDGFAAHHTAVQRMLDASLLLFVIPVSERNHLIITGKLFEYLATGNPILAIGPTNGNASALLKNAQRDEMLEYNDKDNILLQIESAYTSWKNKSIPQYSLNDLERFTRRGLTEKLVNKLNELSK